VLIIREQGLLPFVWLWILSLLSILFLEIWGMMQVKEQASPPLFQRGRLRGMTLGRTGVVLHDLCPVRKRAALMFEQATAKIGSLVHGRSVSSGLRIPRSPRKIPKGVQKTYEPRA
jgi:hypothetical protein